MSSVYKPKEYEVSLDLLCSAEHLAISQTRNGSNVQ